jgi:hypothetical protein
MNRKSISRILALALIVLVFIGTIVVVTRYQTVSVPVLNTPVKAGDVIQASQVSYVSMPANAIFPGLIQQGAQVVGQKAQVDIPASAPLKTDEFVSANTVLAPQLDPNFPYATSEDLPKLRFALPTDLLHSSGGIIAVGNYVNIQLRYTDPSSKLGVVKFILQRVHVIGAEDNGGNNLSGVVTGTPIASSKIAYWFLALTQSQGDTFGAYPWNALFLFKTDLGQPLLKYGNQTVEVATIAGLSPADLSGNGGTTTTPTPTPGTNVTPPPGVNPTPGSVVNPTPATSPKASPSV